MHYLQELSLPKAATEYDLSIAVDDGDSNPVQQAEVTLNGVTKKTDNSGEVTFDDVAVSGGDINCYVSCNGYPDTTEVLEVDDDHTSFTISLEPTTYAYTSFDDSQGEHQMDTGTVKPTGIGTANWLQVEILTAEEIPEWIGTKVYVTREAFPDYTTLYRIYTGAGTGAMDFWVKVAEDE